MVEGFLFCVGSPYISLQISKIVLYLHAELGYGVTVALQIWVLSVQVRILISQPKQ